MNPTLQIAICMSVATASAQAAVVVFDVPPFPTGGVTISHRTELDFDGDSQIDLSINESDGSLCIGNGFSVRCTAGFSVTLAPGIEIFATDDPTQLTEGTIVGPSILGAAGAWQPMDSFTFLLSTLTRTQTGERLFQYGVEPEAEQVFIGFRVQGASDYSYGYLELRQPLAAALPGGTPSSGRYPHLVAVAIESEEGRSITAAPIPEPKTVLFLALASLAFCGSRRKPSGEQDVTPNR